ncbi:MAG: ChaN family lipoprotein [Acidiferrobacterales bacterium]
MRIFTLCLALVGMITLLSCQKTGHPRLESVATYKRPSGQLAVRHDVKAIDLRALSDLDTIIPRLAEQQVVFIGEIHDRFDHHLAQLEIIRALHAIHDNLVIAVEYFQAPFQRYLDAYVAGDVDEKTLLKETEYFSRWGFDYRLYRPIIEYARKHGIPLIALNLPAEISRKVARSGLDGLNDKERGQIPREIDRSDDAYRERLRSVFEKHRQQNTSLTNFDYFVQAQLLWDEAMAEHAANYLRRHPTQHMVILAGNGHLLYGAGIPRRLMRRIRVRSAIVINASDELPHPDMADFLLFPAMISLPPAARLGIYMQSRNHSVVIEDLVPGGAAITAGLKKGDQIVEVNADVVATPSDVKLALLDKQPNDRITVVVKRADDHAGHRLINFEVVLTASH